VSDLNYVGSKTCAYLKALKATFANDGELLASQANLFPEQHHVCLQLQRGAGDPVAYSNKDFIYIFEFWREKAGMMEFRPLVGDLREQVQEYQELYGKRPRGEGRENPAPYQKKAWSAYRDA
jgi:hypothetical protein